MEWRGSLPQRKALFRLNSSGALSLVREDALLPEVLPTDTGYWFFLLLEPSHAVTFALMWSAAVEYGRLAAPPAAQGSAQALLRGTYYYLGVGTGSYVGGRIVKARGFRCLYLTGAAGMVAWASTWAALLAAAGARRRRRRVASESSDAALEVVT